MFVLDVSLDKFEIWLKIRWMDVKLSSEITAVFNVAAMAAAWSSNFVIYKVLIFTGADLDFAVTNDGLILQSQRIKIGCCCVGLNRCVCKYIYFCSLYFLYLETMYHLGYFAFCNCLNLSFHFRHFVRIVSGICSSQSYLIFRRSWTINLEHSLKYLVWFLERFLCSTFIINVYELKFNNITNTLSIE